MKHYFSEGIGTFVLVFFGTAAIIISEEFNGTLNGFHISLIFGLLVAVLIKIIGQFSDCHINPAVTFTFMIDKSISIKKGTFYIVAQIIGAVLASLILHGIFPNNKNLGNTLPTVSTTMAFSLEFLMSGLIILAIILLSTKIEFGKYIYIVIGFIVFLEAWLGGPFTGASMNPARTIGPSIVSGNISFLGIYIIAPIVGMLAFSLLTNKVLKK